MEDRLTKLVRAFYLGSDAAFEELYALLRDEMCGRLKARFRSLEFADIQDLVADWFYDFFRRVRNVRAMAELEGTALSLSPTEVDELKLTYCTAKPNFDFRGTPFNAWLWQVLLNDTLDLSRKLGRRQDQQVAFKKIDTPGEHTEQQWRQDKLREAKEYQQRRDAQIGGEKSFLEMSDEEIALLMQRFENDLKSALDTDQLLYFRIWRKHGYDPPGKTVREVFRAERDVEISDATVSRLKKEFLRISYLVSLEILADAQNMNNLFWRLIKGKENEKTFYRAMLERIWRVFEEDAEAVLESQERISPRLWRELNAVVQQNGQRGHINNLRSQILVAAYHYFRRRGMSPRCCKLVDLYSEDRFGGEIRKLFLGGGETN